MENQHLKQLDQVGNVRCAACGKVSNATAYGWHEGQICALCLECFEKSGRSDE